MLKSKVKFITITFLIFVISFAISQNNYGEFLKDEVTNWKVVITSDTKELTDTQEIKFRVEENKNVVRGKLAPGLKAEANIEIDFSKVSGKVNMADVQVEIDDSNLADCFKLNLKLDGNKYEQNSIKTIKVNENTKIQELTLEIEWINGNDELDTFIGSNVSELRIPIKITVSQHIEH